MNCDTPVPLLTGTPGISCRPPCGAAIIIGNMPIQVVRKCDAALFACAPASAGKITASINDRIPVRAQTRSSAILGSVVKYRIVCRRFNDFPPSAIPAQPRARSGDLDPPVIFIL
jgi:hypothetical protein